MKRVAIVTAASSGLGLAAARALSEKGWTLVLMSRSEAIEPAARDLGGTAVRGDVTEPASLKQLVQTALDLHGRIDGAVINTGHAPKGEPLELSDAAWGSAMDIVLMPTVRLTRLLAPLLRDQGSGSIVAVSSFSAIEPDIDYSLSATFRAALSAFLKICVARHAAEGWRINAVLPGFMDNYPTQESALRRIPAQRYGKVEELGKTIAFLMSDDAAYINGQGILVDGGLVKAI